MAACYDSNDCDVSYDTAPHVYVETIVILLMIITARHIILRCSSWKSATSWTVPTRCV